MLLMLYNNKYRTERGSQLQLSTIRSISTYWRVASGPIPYKQDSTASPHAPSRYQPSTELAFLETTNASVVNERHNTRCALVRIQFPIN